MVQIARRGAELAQPRSWNHSPCHEGTMTKSSSIRRRITLREGGRPGAADGPQLAQPGSGMCIKTSSRVVIFLSPPVSLVHLSRFAMQAKLADSLQPMPFYPPTCPSGIPQVWPNLGEHARHFADVVSSSADSERSLISFWGVDSEYLLLQRLARTSTISENDSQLATKLVKRSLRHHVRGNYAADRPDPLGQCVSFLQATRAPLRLL